MRHDSIASEMTEKLLKARRIFVDSFGDGSVNKTLQSMVVDAVRVSGRSALQRRWAQVVASPGK
jgi:hypothetical protein